MLFNYHILFVLASDYAHGFNVGKYWRSNFQVIRPKRRSLQRAGIKEFCGHQARRFALGW
jgi:hypothetical protein